MIKHKDTLTSHNKITTIFGYSLFALIVLSFLVSTAIPFGFSFQYPGARHFNITVMVLVFATATILPALASYFIGDRATHAKNKSLHHYNGVLFGVAAYWVAQLFSWIGFNAGLDVSKLPFVVSLVVGNVMPVILAIILMAIIAVTYTKKQKNSSSVLQHRLFQVVLIASVVGALLYPYISGNLDTNFVAIAIGMLSVPFVAIGIAYKILAKYHTSRLARLSDAIVAMSMGWVAIWLVDSLMALLQLPYQITAMTGYVAGLIVFVVYLYFLRTRKS